jgi:hypothetical protein
MTRPPPDGRVTSQMKMNSQLNRLTGSGVASFVLAIWFGARELRAAIKASRRRATFQ